MSTHIGSFKTLNKQNNCVNLGTNTSFSGGFCLRYLVRLVSAMIKRGAWVNLVLIIAIESERMNGKERSSDPWRDT